MKPSWVRIISVVFLLITLVLSFSCDDLKEKEEDGVDLDTGDDDDDDSTGWGYPYYLVIGGGLSETLSLLAVKGENQFELTNDVQLTGSAIQQTEVMGQSLYALCSLSNSVVVYDVDDLSIRREVSVGSGNNPIGFAFWKNEQAFVTNFLTDTVSLVDLSKAEDAVMDSVDLGSLTLPKDSGVEQTWARPGGVLVTDAGALVALSNLKNSFAAGGPGVIARIDPVTLEIAGKIELTGRNTQTIYEDSANNAFYAVSAGDYYGDSNGYEGNGKIEQIDPENDAVIRTIELVGAPFEMVMDENGIAYLSNGKTGRILVVDIENGEAKDSIDIRGGDDSPGLSFASALALDGNGILYASEFNHDRLVAIDTRNGNETIGAWTANDGPDTLAFIR